MDIGDHIDEAGEFPSDEKLGEFIDKSNKRAPKELDEGVVSLQSMITNEQAHQFNKKFPEGQYLCFDKFWWKRKTGSVISEREALSMALVQRLHLMGLRDIIIMPAYLMPMNPEGLVVFQKMPANAEYAISPDIRRDFPDEETKEEETVEE